MNGSVFVLKRDTVKERVALNRVVVGLSSCMRSLACGKEKTGVFSVRWTIISVVYRLL